MQALISHLLPWSWRASWRQGPAGAHLKHSQLRCVLEAQVSTSEWPTASASASVMLTTRQAGSSISWHAGPVKPKGHRQRPNWRSQVPRLPQSGWQGLTWCGLKGSWGTRCVQAGGQHYFCQVCGIASQCGVTRCGMRWWRWSVLHQMLGPLGVAAPAYLSLPLCALYLLEVERVDVIRRVAAQGAPAAVLQRPQVPEPPV